MKIRVAPWISIVLFVVAAGAFIAGILLWDDGGVAFLGAGVVGVLFGVLYLGPIYYFAVGEDTISVGMLLFGRSKWRIAPRDRLRFDREGHLVLEHKGQPEHIPVSRGFAHRGDWDTFVKTLERQDGRIFQ